MAEINVLVAARDKKDLRQQLLPYFDYGVGFNVREDEMLEYLVHVPLVRAADFRTLSLEICAGKKAELAKLQVDLADYRALNAAGDSQAIVDRFRSSHLFNPDRYKTPAVAAKQIGKHLARSAKLAQKILNEMEGFIQNGQFGKVCKRQHGGVFDPITGNLGEYYNPNGKWIKNAVPGIFEGQLLLKSLPQLLDESDQELARVSRILALLKLRQSEPETFEQVFSNLPVSVTRTLRHLENTPGDFYWQQDLFPRIQLQLFDLPEIGHTRANYAPAGFVDWQAIRDKIARDAGLAWDNWEAALKQAGVNAREYMEFMRTWKRLTLFQESEEHKDRYEQIWTQIEKRFEFRLAAYERSMVSHLIRVAQTTPSDFESLRDFGESILPLLRVTGHSADSPELALTQFYRELILQSGWDVSVNYLKNAVGSELNDEIVVQAEQSYRERMPLVDVAEAREFKPYGDTRDDHIQYRLNDGLTGAFIDGTGQWVDRPQTLGYYSQPLTNHHYGRHFWKYVQSLPPTLTVYIVECFI